MWWAVVLVAAILSKVILVHYCCCRLVATYARPAVAAMVHPLDVLPACYCCHGSGSTGVQHTFPHGGRARHADSYTGDCSGRIGASAGFPGNTLYPLPSRTTTCCCCSSCSCRFLDMANPATATMSCTHATPTHAHMRPRTARRLLSLGKERMSRNFCKGRVKCKVEMQGCWGVKGGLMAWATSGRMYATHHVFLLGTS